MSELPPGHELLNTLYVRIYIFVLIAAIISIQILLAIFPSFISNNSVFANSSRSA
jgi:hypothetical protein